MNVLVITAGSTILLSGRASFLSASLHVPSARQAACAKRIVVSGTRRLKDLPELV